MKILAFTDSHGSTKAITKIKQTAKKEKVDIIVCCGDFTIFDQNINVLLKKLNSIGVLVLMIHGNHEDEHLLKKATAKFKNIKFIHKKGYRFGKKIFFGYGGGGFSLRDKAFVRFGKMIKKQLKKDSEAILLLHGPPYGTKLDEIIDDHCGNKDFSRFIKTNTSKIKLVLCGHIHENFGKEDKIAKTRVVNPGPFGIVIEA